MMQIIVLFLMQTKFRELNETQEGGPYDSIGDDIYTRMMGA